MRKNKVINELPACHLKSIRWFYVFKYLISALEWFLSVTGLKTLQLQSELSVDTLTVSEI